MTAVLPELPDSPRRRLRALPIPDTEPRPDRDPYLASRVGSGLSRDAALPRMRQRTLALALVTTPDEPPVELPFDHFGPRPTASDELPDPAAWARRMVQAVIEVLTGVRPLAQLVRWTSPDVYAGLQRRGAAAVRPASGRRAVVRSVHLCEPADGVIEACAVVIGNGRARAVALRLEGLDGRWRMTALEIG
jgi:hypothetical protein